MGTRLDLVKQVGSPGCAGGGLRRLGLVRPAGDRPHPDVHREPDRPEPLPAVLGSRRPRPRHGPQRPRHQLSPAPPPLRAAGRDLLHRQRLRGHRRLPPRPPRTGPDPARGLATRSPTSTAPTTTSSPPPKAWGSSATASASSPWSSPRPTSSSPSPPRRSPSAAPFPDDYRVAEPPIGMAMFYPSGRARRA